MKILQRITVAVFAAALCVFGLFYWKEKTTADHTIPRLVIETPELEVNVGDRKEDLMKGVTAWDEKDGDLTDKVLVEAVSPFVEKGVSTITYAVADSDSHVVKGSRTIRFRDYYSPTFYLKSPLIFSLEEQVNIRELIGAVDCVQGDITDRVVITATNYVPGQPGSYAVTVQVSNQLGDRVYLTLPIVVEEQSQYEPEISLQVGMTYVKRGETPDFRSYLMEVIDRGVPMTGYDLRISTDFDPDVPGVYTVHYYVTNDAGYEGHSMLIAVVER